MDITIHHEDILEITYSVSNHTDKIEEKIDLSSYSGEIDIQIGNTYGSRSGSGEIYIGKIHFN